MTWIAQQYKPLNIQSASSLLYYYYMRYGNNSIIVISIQLYFKIIVHPYIDYVNLRILILELVGIDNLRAL